jgi:hypothetical protein
MLGEDDIMVNREKLLSIQIEQRFFFCRGYIYIDDHTYGELRSISVETWIEGEWKSMIILVSDLKEFSHTALTRQTDSAYKKCSSYREWRIDIETKLRLMEGDLFEVDPNKL